MLTLAALSAIVFGMNGFLSLIVAVAIVGLIVWLVTTYIPMPPVFRTVIWVIVVIMLLVWLLDVLNGGGFVFFN